MSDHEHDIDDASLISRPLVHCPACHSTHLEAVVEGVVEDVHFLCQDCGRCWNVALGAVTRVAPLHCLGCPARDRCEQVYLADHTSPSSHGSHANQPIG